MSRFGFIIFEHAHMDFFRGCCNLAILIKYLTFMICELCNEFEPWAGQVQALFSGHKRS